MRFLPHFASDGETLLPLDWTYSYMLLPNDEQDAIRSASVIEQEQKAIQLGLQKDYTPTGHFVLKHWKTQHIHGISVGQVFYDKRQPSWPVPTTTLAGGAGRKTGMPVWRAAPPA